MFEDRHILLRHLLFEGGRAASEDDCEEDRGSDQRFLRFFFPLSLSDFFSEPELLPRVLLLLRSDELDELLLPLLRPELPEERLVLPLLRPELPEERLVLPLLRSELPEERLVLPLLRLELPEERLVLPLLRLLPVLPEDRP
jgi:hypothetical protein